MISRRGDSRANQRDVDDHDIQLGQVADCRVGLAHRERSAELTSHDDVELLEDLVIDDGAAADVGYVRRACCCLPGTRSNR